MGSTKLPSIDPFHDISPLISSPVQVDSELVDHHKLTEEIREHFVNIDIDTHDRDSENDEELVDENGVDFVVEHGEITAYGKAYPLFSLFLSRIAGPR